MLVAVAVADECDEDGGTSKSLRDSNAPQM